MYLTNIIFHSVAFIIWACVQYTGGWEDYAVLAGMTVLGLICRKWKFSRSSNVNGFHSFR